MRLLTKSLAGRLAERHISLEITDKAVTHIATSAYDPVFGARPLKRYLQRDLETKIGRALIAGDITEGSKVQVDLKGDVLAIQVAGADTPEKTVTT